MELKVLIDITDKTEKALQNIATAIETMDAFSTGDFAKLAKGHQVTEKEQTAEAAPAQVAPIPAEVLVPDPVPTTPDTPNTTPEPAISKEELRAMCATAKANGVNVSEIIRTYGHANLFKEVKPEYYGAIKSALDALKGN